MSNQRQYPRTMMKCRIKISHPAFGSLTAQTKDLSDGGVFIEHPDLAALAVGDEVTGQVQDMPIEAPVLRMVIQRVVAGEGVGLAFLDED
ncbi:PilZ domain-containing protein [Pseudomonas sp. FME51]|uniref:PilZ domain-containing protein n=1 Tax=Pseudomonas sp. FME51 TaxID=2742609 RepID=UPI0018684FF5|nr:PilZ domain-containing protein [Pseudomonas sp. FME51]